MPARPPCCVTRPCCGRGEEGRRLAGPGLGGAAAANVVLAKAVGRPPLLRQAALSIATAGDGREWARKWWVPWGPPDACPRPRLLLTLLAVTSIINGRRAGDPTITPLLLLSIVIAQEGKEEGAWEGGVIVDASMAVAVTVTLSSVVAAVAPPSWTPPPTSPPPRERGGNEVTTTPFGRPSPQEEHPPTEVAATDADGGAGLMTMTMAGLTVVAGKML